MNEEKPVHAPHEARTLTIRHLVSGGLITNYNCPSLCRHCLYNSGPHRNREYITAESAERNFRAVKALGCDSVHIGGGEPMLQPDDLAAVLDAAALTGMAVDYVETNSSWYRDPSSATEILTKLKEHGLHTLLISISPFHNEHIPFARVEGVMAASRKAGIRVFPWVDGFVPDMRAMDTEKTHALEEFEALWGENYLAQVLNRYWVHLGGRALDAFRGVLREKPVGLLLEEDSDCSMELSDTGHFHLDLFGNYIPGLCTGLAIRREDLGRPLDAEAYPLLHLLFSQGVPGLYERARDHFGFEPSRGGYINKCDFCTEIRGHLARYKSEQFIELQPLDFYSRSRE